MTKNYNRMTMTVTMQLNLLIPLFAVSKYTSKCNIAILKLKATAEYKMHDNGIFFHSFFLNTVDFVCISFLQKKNKKTT